MGMNKKAEKKRENGNNLLIILVTSGIGGILNAIANLKDLNWHLIDVGIWVVLIVSIILIVVGVILRQYFYRQADQLWNQTLS